MIKKILLLAITTSTNSLHDHVVSNYESIEKVSKLFDIIVSSQCQKCLPNTLISNMDLLPRTNNGCIRVSMQMMIRNFGSFSGLPICEILSIIQSRTQHG